MSSICFNQYGRLGVDMGYKILGKRLKKAYLRCTRAIIKYRLLKCSGVQHMVYNCTDLKEVVKWEALKLHSEKVSTL